MQKTIDPNAQAVIVEPALPGDEGTEESSGYLPAVRGPVQLGSSGSAPDDIDMTGIGPPWLSIAHGVGKLAQAGFNPGSFVLAKEHLLVEKQQPLNVTCLKYDQYYKEYLSKEAFDSGMRPRLFKNADAAKAAGLTTDWVGSNGPQASLAMDWVVLVEKPKDLICGLFGIKIENVEYALALMTFDKKAYASVAPSFLPAAKYTLKDRGVHVAKWEMKTVYSKNKTNSNGAWVPTIRPVGYHSDAFVAALKQQLG